MNKENYIALIISKLNKTIEIQDLKVLETWLGESQENQIIFDDTKNIWKKSLTYKTNFKPNTTLAWEKIQSKIQTTENDKKETKVVSIKKRFPILKIAATLVVLLATGFLMKSYLSDNSLSTFSTAENEIKTFTLPDGSIVELNENSTLSYANDFSKRNVSLKGEAFFKITEDKNSPFTVSVNETKTTVLGTSFNIDANSSEKVEVALFTGKIKFTTARNAVVLNPGEKILYNTKNQAIDLMKSGIENEISWKTNKLVFNNTSITEVLKVLENHFDTTIILINEKSSNCTFSGVFENEKLSSIVESIAYSFDTKSTFKNGLYHIDSLNCSK